MSRHRQHKESSAPALGHSARPGLLPAGLLPMRWAAWCHGGVAALALAALTAAAGSAASAPPPPAESFTRSEAIGDFALSPSGKHLAVVLTAPNGYRVAAVIDLAQPEQHKVVADFANANVNAVYWINDERLFFTAAQPGYYIDYGGTGSFAVNRDGSELRRLTAWVTDSATTGTRIASRVLPWDWTLYTTVRDGSADVLMTRVSRDTAGDRTLAQLGRLDTLTGQLRLLTDKMPDQATRWIVDREGQPRVVQVKRDGRDKLFWQAPGSSEWTLLEDRDANSDDTIQPAYLEGDGTLIVAARNGRDTTALWAYDTRRRKVDPEPLLAMEGYDVAARLVTDSATRTVVGVHASASGPLSIWFDPRLAGIQKAVDAALPAGRANRLYCSPCASAENVVVLSTSDRQPGEMFLYQRANGTLRRIGRARPWLDEASQGTRSFHRVAARDGLSLPVIVTHPGGKAADEPLPAVLLVHGGPWVRGSTLTWDAEAQFLASRGFRVLEVEFRGSLGFGWRHFRASWQQWGLQMQDDLADAVAWAAKEKLIDPRRVCIYGGSYGGYAALMGPARHPGTYRCAASAAGVTDIDLMYSGIWGDISVQAKRYAMPLLIGERERDAERLRATSPISRVAEVKVPVLLVQGGVDRRVPEVHADRYLDAARKAGVNIEYVRYAEEGHGWYSSDNHADFLRRLERFLNQALRP